MKRIGIIDLGSNSSRLVIYDIHPNGGYRPSYRLKKNIRIASHIGEGMRISPEGIQKALASAHMFQNVGRLYGVTEWIAVATAAFRQAKNGDTVLELLEKETGLSVRLLTGEQEAWYGYLAVMNTMDVEDAVLIDIGGASTEVIHVRNRQFLNAVSLPYGALTLTKQFNDVNPAVQTESVRQFILEQLVEVDWLGTVRGLPLIGMGGTIRAIGKISNQLRGDNANRLHGYRVESSALKQIYEVVKSVSSDERRNLGDLSESRAEVVHAGIAAVKAVADTTAADGLFVSGSGLRDGLFYEYLLQDRPQPLLDSVKEHSLQNLLRLYGSNLNAAHQTAVFAEKLFDDLGPVHRLGVEQKRLMRASALLGMTGTFINVEKYTKHTDYLIRSSYLYGFTMDEMANISRIIMGKGHKSFKQLHVLIELAKFFVYEVGIPYEDLTFHIHDDSAVTISSHVFKGWDGDLKNSLKGVEKYFDIRIG